MRKEDRHMNTQSILLEVALESVDDARAARRGGANRLELCAALDLGGLTPSYATITEVKRAVDLPVMAMIRPRPGGFGYSDAEFAVMEADIDAAIRAGADALVFGVLLPDGNLDLPRMRRLRERCAGRPAVCHRAFDFTPDPVRALDELIALGFTRVLTAGQHAEVAHPVAMQLVRRLREQAAGRIEILPGAGVRPHNVSELIRVTGCAQVHGAFRAPRLDASTTHKPGVSLGPQSVERESSYNATDEELVREVRRAIGEK
jgi:copper homeostasis protein